MKHPRRRLIVLFLVFAFYLSLAACDKTASSDPQSSNATNATNLPTDLTMTDEAAQYNLTPGNYPRIDGSTSTLGIVQAVWKAMVRSDTSSYDEYYAYYPSKASKEAHSYQLLINGDVDLIIVPYASEDVLREAKDAGVELEFHKITAEALVFITPKDNPTDNITGEQVRSIYLKNAIRNWSELGGPDRELVPICRNADSVSQSQMDNLILHNEPMDPGIENNYVELATAEDMLQQVAFYHNGGLNGVATNSYALGYTLYSCLENVNEMTGIGNYLKMLAYEGVMPTRQSIADDSYPLSDGYYAVIRKDLPDDHSARSVIRWLQSPSGITAIEDCGFIPCGGG